MAPPVPPAHRRHDRPRRGCDDPRETEVDRGERGKEQRQAETAKNHRQESRERGIEGRSSIGQREHLPEPKDQDAGRAGDHGRSQDASGSRHASPVTVSDREAA